MNLIEARRTLLRANAGERLEFTLAMSGTSDVLTIFIRAHAALQGFDATIHTLPFGTLGQHLHASPQPGACEAFLLCPWDLFPAFDWRAASPTLDTPFEDVISAATAFVRTLSRRNINRVFYLDAPIPPFFSRHEDNLRAGLTLKGLIAAEGATVLDPECFALGAYFASGCPIRGDHLDRVAGAIFEKVVPRADGPGKVLVTDLDNTLWAGVVGEDGPEGVRADGQGVGFRHFAFQNLLLRLKRRGAVLAAASRNDPDLAEAPFSLGRMPLNANDFFSIRASYGAKSDAVRAIATDLNVGLSSVVVVDDNPIELHEVKSALPDVQVLEFPRSDDGFPMFADTLSALFSRDRVTEEDQVRTELYRARAATHKSRAAAPSMHEFLADLAMTMTITDRSRGDRTRAVQLINKTNQFNLNGQRWDDAEIGSILQQGGKLLTASLSDKYGNHGEVVSILIDQKAVVRAFVLSCRVFQRRMEFAFLAAIRPLVPSVLQFAFQETERNAPFRDFAREAGLGSTSTIDLDAFSRDRSDDSELFDTRVSADVVV